MSGTISSCTSGITMTEEPLYKNIFLFSIPLIFFASAAGVVQYGGRCCCRQVLQCYSAGVCRINFYACCPLYGVILIGFSNGVNVRAAQYLGAQQNDDTRRCVHTALILCTFFGVLITLLCVFFAAPMLEILKTKDDLLPGAVLYFRIYALGMPALGIFNFGNAVLSATGDTKRPLAYLTAAGILNVVLNLFFVIVCKMAADGVALASIISQYLGANRSKNLFMPPDAYADFSNRKAIMHGEAVLSAEEAQKVLDETFFYPPIKHGYVASICGRACDRACYIHLEQAGKLKNGFTTRFRKRKDWKLSIDD